MTRSRPETTVPDIGMSWLDAFRADDYVILEDERPGGMFRDIATTAPSGLTGARVDLPPGNRFYLVVGRNHECGLGHY